MYKALLICLTNFLFFQSYSQIWNTNVAVKLFIEDAVGHKDTVTFGLNDTSTLGIDTSFSEFNILGEAFDSLDIRVIQRDSVNFNCIRVTHYGSPAPNLYFPGNIDSKIDFRPFGSFGSVYTNFEIFISAQNYPVVMRADFSGIQGSFLEGWSVIHLLNNNCDAVDTKPIYYSPANDTLFTLTDSFFNTLVANFQHEVGIGEQNSMENLVTIFPNPLTEKLCIKFSEMTLYQSTFIIYNIFGQEVLAGQLSWQNEIMLGQLANGIYLLQISGDKKVLRRKFIKQ